LAEITGKPYPFPVLTFLRHFFTLVILVMLALAAAFFYLRGSLPREEGEIRLAGLLNPVEVVRDAYGVPHISAASVDDAIFALGFVHAQDRLWQMEVNRRTAAGRLAEVFGANALETDRFLRTLGVRRSAEANLKRLDKDTRAQLESYAAGVNAFMGTNPVLPIEFWLTGAKPEPWTPVDSLGWIKIMAWHLGGNWRNEILRMRLSKTLPLARIHEFLPPYPGEAPPEITDLRRLYSSIEKEAPRLAEASAGSASGLDLALQNGPRLGTSLSSGFGFDVSIEGLGSNNWVVSGARSATGKPLLANDPHLGLTAPAVWYFAHLSAPGLEAIGATLPGVPAIVLGRNSHFAWGFTNTGPDVQDLYIERLDGAGNYLAPDGPRPFTLHEEVIKVKGGEDVRLQVRVSRHGPVISDVSRIAQEAAPRGHVIAMQWTALREDDLTMQSAVKIARAKDWPGFVAAGRVPARKPDNDLTGLAPAPGWIAKYDWAGFIPYEELPRAYNPADGAITTANHRITPRGYPHYLTSEWQPPYRANRITELLGAVRSHSVGSFARIQGDVVSQPVKELLPRLARVTPKSEQGRRALQLLLEWDGAMLADRPEPLILAAWWREFSRAIYADELGDNFRGNWLLRAQFLINVLNDKDRQGRWCDNTRTKAVEHCDDLLAKTLDDALADLRKRYGDDMSAWRWGAAHSARHEHRPFGRVVWLAPFFDFTAPTGGDAYTVNVGRSRLEDAARPFANTHAASLRAIYDLGDLDNSLYIHSGGQSGNVLSPHYKAFTQAWAKGDYIPMVTDRKRIEIAGSKRLRLVP